MHRFSNKKDDPFSNKKMDSFAKLRGLFLDFNDRTSFLCNILKQTYFLRLIWWQKQLESQNWWMKQLFYPLHHEKVNFT